MFFTSTLISDLVHPKVHQTERSWSWLIGYIISTNPISVALLFVIWSSIIFPSAVSTPGPLLSLSCPSQRAQKRHLSIYMRHIRLKNTLNVNVRMKNKSNRTWRSHQRLPPCGLVKGHTWIYQEKQRLAISSQMCVYFCKCVLVNQTV